MLASKFSPYLKRLIKTCPAVYNQFTPSDKEEVDDENATDDPLLEEEHTVTRGLLHKYENRALILTTMNCAAYCRFCTRRRKVSDIKKGILTDADLDKMLVYLKKHLKIKELIFSGGDPLTVPAILKKALKKFSKLPQIKIIRIGSRLPVSNPSMVNKQVLDALKVVKNQPLYLMLHFDHPAEITKATIQAVKRLQSASTMLLSHTVSLKGVNDSFEVLYDLFSRLVEIGVKPYYFFRCDPVKGAEHFIVDIKKEIQIFTELRKHLSGLACPAYVIDAPHGSGKIPVPLNFWKFDSSGYVDFDGKKLKV